MSFSPTIGQLRRELKLLSLIFDSSCHLRANVAIAQKMRRFSQRYLFFLLFIESKDPREKVSHILYSFPGHAVVRHVEKANLRKGFVELL
jgi:hypothetical protein